ncbi:hypothetical protein DAPPUDRAFT_344216, partial [Daphnia pulex]
MADAVGMGVAHESIRMAHQLYFSKNRNEGWIACVRHDDASRDGIPNDLKYDCPDYEWPKETSLLLSHVAVVGNPSLIKEALIPVSATDMQTNSLDDLPMLAWQKAFDAFAEDVKPEFLDKWVTRLIGDQAKNSQSRTLACSKEQLTQWVRAKDVSTRLSACRSQMMAFPQSNRAQKQLEHQLILLLAIHAVMQVGNLVDHRQELQCPESVAQVQDYEVAIAIVAHLYYGQGCVLELRGEQWRVANMIRTDALEPMGANPARNGNIMRIEHEVQSHMKRTRPGLFPPTSDMERFKSDHGGVPFVLDVQRALDAQACAALSQDLNLKVIPVGADDALQIESVMEKVHSELCVLFGDPHHVNQTKKEDTMTDKPVGQIINNTWNVTGNI